MEVLNTASFSAQDARDFRRRLLRWYRKNGRDLPWRRTSDPYHIFVSEVMLQQTQVSVVIPYYERWLRRFPNIESVAQASENDVLHSWQGLGYYSRARNLQAAARIVSKKYRGRFPQCVDKIGTLPGVGRYTANAVASFAFDHPVPVVEANIARVLARLFNFQKPIDTTAGREAIWKKAALLLPKGTVREHNSALMELGALICVPHRPKCDRCPVHHFCIAKDPSSLPKKKARPTLLRVTENHTFRFSRGRVLLEKSRTRWSGMWVLPRLAASPAHQQPLYVSQFPFTHHCITLSVFAGSRHDASASRRKRWFSLSDFAAIPMPPPHRRAVIQLLSSLPA